MGRVARLILLVVVSVCVVFCVLCCLQNNLVFLSVTILSHISKNENYQLCILAGFLLPPEKSSSHLSGRCAIIITTGKKRSSSRLSGGCAIIITTGKKKIQLSVWRVCDHYYNRKKKFQSSVWRVCDRYYDQNKKGSSCLSGGYAIVITTRKKKFQSSVWQVCICYYDRKKNVLVQFLVLRKYLVYNVQLCCCVSFLVVAGNSSYQFNLN